MKKNLIAMLTLSTLVLISCDTFKQKRANKKNPEVTEEQRPLYSAYGTKDLIKKNLTFVPAEKNCQNLKDFLENYKEAFLTNSHFVIYDPCIKDTQHIYLKSDLVVSKDQKIEFKIGVNLSELDSLDGKIRGESFVNLSPGETFEPATRLAATFLKWTEENTSTAREICVMMGTPEEQCLTELKPLLQD